jgi:hypothetical protein
MKDEMKDSTKETQEHISKVAKHLAGASIELLNRARVHDDSKLQTPEKELFDKYTHVLDKVKYDSPEYHECLKGLKPALDHHYANNTHHPQYYENGIDGMDLFDVMEMFWDWCAATERTKDGDIRKSIEINKGRFEMSDQLASIFMNTVDRYYKK